MKPDELRKLGVQWLETLGAIIRLMLFDRRDVNLDSGLVARRDGSWVEAALTGFAWTAIYVLLPILIT